MNKEERRADVSEGEGESENERGAGVQEVIDRFLTMEFLREERKLPKKEALSLLSVVRHGVATCHENPSSPSFAAWNSPHRREAEKNFRHQLWLHMAHPRQARMLRTECVDALAVAYIRLSAQLPWKEPPR